LTTDPESAELLKLKEDLLQVIDLTKELIAAQTDGPSSGAGSRQCHMYRLLHNFFPNVVLKMTFSQKRNVF
jgi:hypothetical protein